MGEFPNKDAQWQPGESGNPKGKPKGTHDLSTWIQKLLNDDKFFGVMKYSKATEVHYKGAPIKAIIAVAMMRAMQGDERWAEWLAKHGYGSKLIVQGGDPVEAALEKLGLLGSKKDAGQDSGATDTTS